MADSYYVVVAPFLSANGSTSDSTLYRFEAVSDEAAIAAYQQELKKALNSGLYHSRIISGGVNWSKATKLYRVELDGTRTLIRQFSDVDLKTVPNP